MKRREVLKIGAAVPAAAAAQQSLKTAAAWKPKFFTPAQNEAVIALTEAIIPATDTPGAGEARVNRYLDLFLSQAPASESERFRKGFEWLESYTAREYKNSFAKLSRQEQTAVLASLDKGGEGLVEGQRFFRGLKQLTSRIYYSTEAGFKEMNKGGRVPKSFGCPHPERHA